MTLDSSVALSDLLREAFAVAKKLNAKDFYEWIMLEQNGYGEHKVPDYRKLCGELKAFNPYKGYIPVILPTVELTDMVSNQTIICSVIELESAIEMAKNKGEFYLMMTVPAGFERELNDQHGNQIYMKLCVHIPIPQYIRILDSVRNKILDWAIELENNNVLGYDLIFSPEEKESSLTINYIKIQEMYNSQIQQAAGTGQFEANIDIKKDSIDYFVKIYEEKVCDLVMSDDDLKTIKADIETLKAQLKSAKPKSRIVKECFTSIRHILEGLAGNAAAIYLLSILPK